VGKTPRRPPAEGQADLESPRGEHDGKIMP
jgi:hypothetical protein